MKRLIFLNLLLLLISKNHAQKPVIEFEKLHVAYLGLTNPVAIAVEGMKNSDLKISTDNGSIELQSDGTFYFRPQKSGKATVFVEWNGKKEERVFRVKVIPVRAEVYNTNNFNKVEFTGVIIRQNFGNIDFEEFCKTYSYRINLISKTGEVKELTVFGHISLESTALVRSAKKGDTTIFKEIKCKCPDEIPRLLPDEIIVKINQ